MNTHLLTEHGFATYVLRDSHAEVRVVPALGGKITSLRSLRTGREWLWSAPDGRGLHTNQVGDAFEGGPMAGIDDCLPTVAPCRLGDSALPDHGEVWSRACNVDATAWSARGELKTSLTLSTLPLRFERTLSLRVGALTLAYRLTNHSAVPQPWLWALHPLFAWQAGDRIELPAEVTTMRVSCELALGLTGVCAWPAPAAGFDLSRMTAPTTAPWYLKLFTGPMHEGRAAVVNDRTGDRLELRF
ncbi:MAG: hypothetical protein H7067_19225, partial [Burkholderiales bacterium]|nr:hypothetical protein [Opitutaceae bacterium]